MPKKGLEDKMIELLPPLIDKDEIVDFFKTIDTGKQLEVLIDDRTATCFFNTIDDEIVSFTDFEPFHSVNLFGQNPKFVFRYSSVAKTNQQNYIFSCQYLGEYYCNKKIYYLFKIPFEIIVKKQPFAVLPMLGEKAILKYKLGFKTITQRIERISFESIHFKTPPSELYNFRNQHFTANVFLDDISFKAKGILDYDENYKTHVITDYIENRKIEKQIQDYFEKHIDRGWNVKAQHLEFDHKDTIIALAHTVSGKQKLIQPLKKYKNINLVSSSEFNELAFLIELYSCKLIIIDPDILYMNAWELLHDASNLVLPSQIPVIIVSGLKNEKITPNIKISAKKFLPKPLKNEDYIAVIEKLVSIKKAKEEK